MTCTDELEKPRCRRLREGIRDDRTCPGKLANFKIANGPSQLQRDVKLRASDDGIPPHIVPDVEEIPSDDQEGDDRIPPQ